jgi:hypothetical protein
VKCRVAKCGSCPRRPIGWSGASTPSRNKAHFSSRRRTGARLGPVASGAGHVIVVIGAPKLVPDFDTGLRANL